MKRGTYYALFFVVAVFSLMLLVGCSKPPTEELGKVEKAIEEAKGKEANLYAEDAFKKAEESLKKAKDQIAAKQYKEAAQTLMETMPLAQQAMAGVEPGKTKMKEEAEKYIAEAQKALDELKTDVAAAIKKKLPVQREEVEAAIGKWGVDLAGIKDKLQSGKIREAFDELKAMVEAVKVKIEDIAKLAPAAPVPSAAPPKK
jgi:major membrane immunogen (membrane-anchored lipoprotein)